MVVGTQCPHIPASKLEFIKGQPVDVAAGRGVQILEFWAHWCGPCRAVTPHLTKLQKEFPKATFIGVTTDRDVQKAKQYVDSKGDEMAYTVAVDAQGATDELTHKANLAGIPHAFVIGADNKITFSGHPASPEFVQKLKEAIDSSKPQVPIPPVAQSIEELRAMPIKELKHLLEERGIPCQAGLEKHELAQFIKEKAGNVTYYR